MSENQRNFRVSQHFVLRPLFSVFTLLFVSLAILQATGRLTAAVLHLFEDEVNAVLLSRNISVGGLRGDWQGLNPVLSINKLQLPAGNVSGIDVELDLLESLLRSALVPRRLHIEQISLDIDETPRGWRLRGLDPTQPAPDWQALLQGPLRHVDNLNVNATLSFHTIDSSRQYPAQLSAEVESINRGGRHYLHALVSNADVMDESLQLLAWQQEALLWVTESVNTIGLHGRLRLPNVLAGMPDLQLVVEQGTWNDVAGDGAGQLDMVLEGLRLAATGRAHRITLAVDAQRRQHVVDAITRQLQVAAGAQQYDFDAMRISLQLPERTLTEFEIARQLLTGEVTPPMLRMWLGHLDLGDLSTFLVDSTAQSGAAGRWIKALAVRGKAKNVHAFFDREAGVGYRASVSDLDMQGYKGAPTLAAGQGVLWGYHRGMAMQLNAADVQLQFPDLFHDKWAMDHISGVVKGWFGPGYFALEGSHLKARMGSTGIAGHFALSRPDERYDQRVGLLLSVDEVDLLAARTYIPYKIPEQLSDWLAHGPRGGLLRDANFVYHGQVHQRPDELARRIELKAQLINGVVQYDPAWPLVEQVNAAVHVAGTATRVNVRGAQSNGLSLADTSLTLVDNGLYADIALRAQGQGAQVLDFIRSSPLQQTMNFVSASWRSAGDMHFAGELLVPLRELQPATQADKAVVADATVRKPRIEPPPLSVRLDLQLSGVDLLMPEYRTHLSGLNGQGEFRLPHHLSGDFQGELFGQAARIEADSDNNWLWFDINGTATPADIYELIQYDGQAPIDGDFDFASRLNIAVGGGVTNLSMTTDLQGLSVSLPGEFGKSSAQSVPLELDVQFLSEYQSLRWQYQTTNGWLHVTDAIQRGAIGVNQPPPMTAQEDAAILISGRMSELNLGDWVSPAGESSFALPIDWTIRNLFVDRFVIDELAFAELALTGQQRGADAAFQFASEHLQGQVQVPGDGLLNIELDYLRLPVAATEPLQPAPDTTGSDVEPADTADPLSVEVGRSLPDAQVKIAQLDLGESPFGSWDFVMRAEQDRVVLEPFVAHVNGVHFADSRIVWDLRDNRSAFTGVMNLDDLQQTLPQWNYAASLQTSKATLSADANWPGSPANVNLLTLSGQLALDAEDGRFLEVEGGQGGLRILSLINFSKIAKRISFDFSDVVGSGISFDTIAAKVNLQEGTLNFSEPMLVDSSSGIYQVGGQVNLDTGRLDNEMIVTLPVSNSLPWYGVYLALANPLAGLGVLVGERVLRKPIKQFSTAKFEVSGTLDEPKVEFVSLWDRSMKNPDGAAETPAEQPEAESSAPLAEPDPANAAARKSALRTDLGSPGG